MEIKNSQQVMDEDHFELIHETLERITEAMSDCLERRADLHTAPADANATH